MVGSNVLGNEWVFSIKKRGLRVVRREGGRLVVSTNDSYARSFTTISSMKFIEIILNVSIPTSQKAQCSYISKTDLLILFGLKSLTAGLPRNPVSSRQEKKFFLFSLASTPNLGIFLQHRYPGFFPPRVQRLGRENDQSTQFTVEVME